MYEHLWFDVFEYWMGCYWLLLAVTGCYWLLLANTPFRNRLTDKTGDVFNNNCTHVTTAVIQFLFDFVKQDNRNAVLGHLTNITHSPV